MALFDAGVSSTTAQWGQTRPQGNGVSGQAPASRQPYVPPSQSPTPPLTPGSLGQIPGQGAGLFGSQMLGETLPGEGGGSPGPEPTPPAPAPTPTPPTAPPPAAPIAGSRDWIIQQLKNVDSTDDPAYWERVMAADPKVAAGDQSAINYWIDRMRRGDGSALIKNGTLQKFQDGPAGNVFTDPATTEWETMLRQLVAKMNQPQPTWTPAQLELQQTQVLDPLEHQRQQQKQQMQVNLSSRGIAPGSGVYESAMADIDRQFNQMRTQTQGNFATQAIQREDQVFNNNEQRGQNALNIFGQIPQLADRRLATAQGTLQNPMQLIQMLMSQQNTQQQNGMANSAQNQQFWSQIAQLLAGMFS